MSKNIKFEDTYIAKRQYDLNNYVTKRFIPNNTLRVLHYASGGYVKAKQIEGMLDVVNGHPIRGLKKVK